MQRIERIFGDELVSRQDDWGVMEVRRGTSPLWSRWGRWKTHQIEVHRLMRGKRRFYPDRAEVAVSIM